MDTAHGRKNTSVPISSGFMPGPFQNDEVSFSKMFTFTSQSSLPSARRFLLALAPPQAGFMPHAKQPFTSPLSILSKMFSQK